MQRGIRERSIFKSVLLSQDYFGCLGSFVVPYKLQGCLFYFSEKCHWYFDGDCIESVDCLKECGHFNNINSSDP